MKYLIDKEKLEARIYKLLAGDGKNQADNVEGIALCALRGCLVPYEEKKEECEHNAGTRINGKMICDYCKQDVSGQVVMKGNPDNKEQDTRTHAWETKTYTQDAVREMLEDLKKRDWNTFLEELGEWNRGYHECADEVNAKIDKKIAEL